MDKNDTGSQVQALNEEIHFVVGRKLAEDGMQWVSKEVMAALIAIALTVSLILSREKGNHEQDEQVGETSVGCH